MKTFAGLLLSALMIMPSAYALDHEIDDFFNGVDDFLDFDITSPEQEPPKNEDVDDSQEDFMSHENENKPDFTQQDMSDDEGIHSQKPSFRDRLKKLRSKRSTYSKKSARYSQKTSFKNRTRNAFKTHGDETSDSAGETFNYKSRITRSARQKFGKSSMKRTELRSRLKERRSNRMGSKEESGETNSGITRADRVTGKLDRVSDRAMDRSSNLSNRSDRFSKASDRAERSGRDKLSNHLDKLSSTSSRRSSRFSSRSSRYSNKSSRFSSRSAQRTSGE